VAEYSSSCPYLETLNFYETMLLSIYEELMKQIVMTPYTENTTEEYFNFLKASHTIDQVLNIPFESNVEEAFGDINFEAKLMSKIYFTEYSLV
jgi:hypothetical protein